jgi:hypothetical protein
MATVDYIVIMILIVITIILVLTLTNFIQPLKPFLDIFIYLYLVGFIIPYWVVQPKSKNNIPIELLSLSQSTSGGAAQAGLVAASIFIPLSLTTIQLIIGTNNIIGTSTIQLSATTKGIVQSLIIAVYWFGFSVMMGVIGLWYTNQSIGQEKNVLKERKVGIPLVLQLYAILIGVLRILYAISITWAAIGI